MGEAVVFMGRFLGSRRSTRLALGVLAFAGLGSLPAVRGEGGEEAAASVGVPDLKIIGWTVDDGIDGNGDGGLHPGETALLQIYLSNQGNETARNVAGTLFEVTDHPDVEILDKFALWPDLSGTGDPASTVTPHFRIQVAQTRPCNWEIPLRLEIIAEGGYFESREFTLVMVDPQATDLAGGAARPFHYGAVSNDGLGISVASGDLDGDGFDDLILGAPGGDGPAETRSSAGEVTVIYGGPVRPTDTDLAAPSGSIAFIYGLSSADSLGSSLASGDLDGDGFDDLILGAPGGDGPADTRPTAGEVAVVYGGPVRLPLSTDLASPPGSVAFIYGIDSGDSLGDSVAAGDLDGDGFDDLILGVESGDGPANARSGAGEVAVIYGGPVPLSSTTDLAAPPGSVAFVYGADSNDVLGNSVASGDLDGDGFDDLILGATAGDGPADTRSSAGEVAVIYGGPVPLSSTTDLAAPPGSVAFVYGANSSDLLGASLASADLDGDGFDDLILGATFGDGPGNTRFIAGEVAVVYGGPVHLSLSTDLASPPGSVAFIYGADSGDRVGASVASGDLDGDGFDDLVLGADGGDGPANTRLSAGDVVVIYGGPARPTATDLASTPGSVAFVYGADVGDQLGRSVASADLDGDGFDDLILGADLGDGPGNTRGNAGEVAVIPGSARSRYRHDPDTFSFIDATIGTNLGLACDDCSVAVPIGFELDFFGRKHTEVIVSSNGYLTFGGPGNLPAGFCPPASNPPDGVIAPLWDDWNPAAGGAVYSLLQGTAPNRRFTVEWSGVPLFPATGAATFEATLFETSDQILFQYQDVVVGSAFSDNGETAVVGVENAVGLNGVAADCFTPTVGDGSAVRFRRFANPTVVFSDDVEAGAGAWTATGLWHPVMDPTCAPSSRSGDFSWYYGQDSTCNYETGAANSGTLTSPLVPALAQDAALRFWHRRRTEAGDLFDRSFVEAQGDGGGFVPLEQVPENSNTWRHTSDFLAANPPGGVFSSLDLTSFAGQDLNLRFRFDTIDNMLNNFLGWMVDDVEIRACPVFGAAGAAGAAAEARATAQPTAICETGAGQVDAVGSYCAACGTALTYQWREGGVAIPGATGVTHAISAGHAPGMFDFTVAIGCTGNPACADDSDPAGVTVVQAPVEVGPTFAVNMDSPGTNLQFHWGDVAGAGDYVVFSSPDPAVPFTNVVGSAVSGAGGLTVPLDPAPLVYYLVAGRNPVCGVGPQR